METPRDAPIDATPLARRLALGAASWAAGALAMLALDGHADLANLSMVLVLASAIASVWLPLGLSLLASAVAVLAFNWSFVPPRGAFTVDLHQDAALLLALMAVTGLVGSLMAAQRASAERARLHARHAEQLRRFGEALRDVDDPVACAGLLQSSLAEAVGTPEVRLLLRRPATATAGAEDMWVGLPSEDQRIGLGLCADDAKPLGPGSGRQADLPEWYLPLRGRAGAHGAALLLPPEGIRVEPARRAQAQALCDQMGVALERAASARAATAAQDRARLQGMRNTLLAAVSHDYRTPLATILGAASSLLEQAERLDPQRRRRLAASIVEEATRLGRLTDNTLQLARLDAPGVALQRDWESAEELVGTSLQRARRHDGERRVRARLEPGLPLVHCDALLIGQLLDNLIDNALKYSEPPAPVELLVRRLDGQLVFAVRDRGPGVAPAARDRIFDAFERGPPRGGPDRPPGSGVGLALCRAIAQAHGGELRLRARAHGGSSFECWLPAPPPPRVEDEAAAGALQ